MQSMAEINTSAKLAPVKVLVIGGSYGGLAAALNLLDLCQGKAARFSAGQTPSTTLSVKTPVRIRIVDERDGFYHLIGSPLALASREFARKAWVRFQDIPALRAEGVSHVQGSVVQVDMERKVARVADSATQSETEEEYDYLVAASGLRRAWPVVPQSLSRDGYLSEVEKHVQAVKNATGVVVIGGGAVGIEMAAELKVIEPEQIVTLIHSRDKLLSSEPLPDDCKDRALELLRESGVLTIMGQRVEDTKSIEPIDGHPRVELTLSNGSKITAGHVITALSRSVPATSYLPQNTLDGEQLVKIKSSLQFEGAVPNANQHFAVGDLASWSGIKRCGGAMHMGHHAAMNIHQLILEKQIGKAPELLVFPAVPPMIALAVGKSAVTYDPEGGTKSGEEQMKIYFGDDLGRSICWNYMQLSNDSSVGQEGGRNNPRTDNAVSGGCY